MNVAIIDFETTGVDTETCRPIEVCVAIVSNDFTSLVAHYQALLYASDYPEIEEHIELLTGIQKEQVIVDGIFPPRAFDEIYKLFLEYNVGHVIAYNAEYDHDVYKKELERHGIANESVGNPAKLPWLCAMKDVKSNYNYKCWKLSHLALDYGVAIDPKELHRASADVFLTRDLLRAAKTTAEEMLSYKNTPWVALEAVTREPWKDGGKSTSLAKSKGFSWETPKGHQKMKYPKKWVKLVKETDLQYELSETLFQVRRI